jgi:hypothetical protein
VAPDRNPQTVKLVKPNLLHRPGPSISEDYGLADKFSLGLLELAEDRGGADVGSWHGCLEIDHHGDDSVSKRTTETHRLFDVSVLTYAELCRSDFARSPSPAGMKHNLLIRLALNPDDEALAAPQLYRVAVEQLLGPRDGIFVIQANECPMRYEMSVVADRVRAIFCHFQSVLPTDVAGLPDSGLRPA